MKLLDICEADISTKNVSIALPKIAAYLSRKLGIKLIKIPGVEHFHNSSGNGYGVRYVVSGSTRCFRINWNTEGSTGSAASIHSIDIFNGKSRDPSFTITTKGISFAQALPMVVTIAASPTLGKHLMFPVSPQLALSESVDALSKANTFKKGDKVKINSKDWDWNGKSGTIANVYPNGYSVKLSDVDGMLIGVSKREVEVDESIKEETKSSKKKHISLYATDNYGNSKEHMGDFDNLKSARDHFVILDDHGSWPNNCGVVAIDNDTKKEYVDVGDGWELCESINLIEAHRDDFTAEQALGDFLKQLSKGKSFTRSDFIGNYHIINAGIFDTAFIHFKDRFIIDNKRISLASNAKLDALKDSILAKAGVVEVTKGGSKEVYLKTDQEEKLESKDDKAQHVPFEDTLEHLEGLVVALIKGSTNALFVAGKGGVGKTQTVERVLHDHGLSDGKGYFKNTGSASAPGVYTLLYHHRNEIILFDDSDGALKDVDARNLIKAATDTKKVRKLVWNKKSSFIFNPDEEDPSSYKDDLGMAPQYFDFKGRIIFISNLPLNQLDPDGALRTRAFVINVDPTDEELFGHMGKILMDIKLEDGLSMGKDEREHVLKVVKTSKRKEGVSIRMLVRALNLAASGAKNWEKLVALYC